MYVSGPCAPQTVQAKQPGCPCTKPLLLPCCPVILVHRLLRTACRTRHLPRWHTHTCAAACTPHSPHHLPALICTGLSGCCSWAAGPLRCNRPDHAVPRPARAACGGRSSCNDGRAATGELRVRSCVRICRWGARLLQWWASCDWWACWGEVYKRGCSLWAVQVTVHPSQKGHCKRTICAKVQWISLPSGHRQSGLCSLRSESELHHSAKLSLQTRSLLFVRCLALYVGGLSHHIRSLLTSWVGCVPAQALLAWPCCKI